MEEEYYETLLSKEDVDDEYIPHNGTGMYFVQPCPKHKYKISQKGEKYYKQPQNLIQKLKREESQRLQNLHLLLNRVVYDSIDPSPINKKSSGPYYVPSNDDTTLVFESRFECGNLRRAIQVYEYEYDLILKFDVNTRNYSQWFYFSVDNIQTGIKYKFNIINLLKNKSLYNEGMKPLIYNVEKNEWLRGGFEIGYFQNNIKRKTGYFYTLTFSYVFQHKGKHYFAYCYPYSYTNLKKYLYNLGKNPVRRKLFRRRALCQTLAGNNVDLITITSFSGDPQDLKKRKGIVISARVHPGETNSSWMMKGVIDFLTSPSIDAQILRDNFVFKIIPMLNPDGVINGNYRCSLAGCDLNRKWDFPSKKLHPSIWHAKMMLKLFQEERSVVLFVDLHGHSKKKNIFMYGCFKGKTREEKLRTRIFPRILWKLSKYFSFSDCSFNMSKTKCSSARMVVFKEYNILNSFTLESSFCGPQSIPKHFTFKDFEEMGYFVCLTILDAYDPDKTRLNQVKKELNLLFPTIEALDNIEEEIQSDDEDFEQEVNEKKKEEKKDKSEGGSKKKKKKKKKKKMKKKMKKRSKKSEKKSLGSGSATDKRLKKKKLLEAIENSDKKDRTDKKLSVGRSKSRPKLRKLKKIKSQKDNYTSNSKKKKKKKLAKDGRRLSIGFFESYKSFRTRLFKENRFFGEGKLYSSEVQITKSSTNFQDINSPPKPKQKQKQKQKSKSKPKSKPKRKTQKKFEKIKTNNDSNNFENKLISISDHAKKKRTNSNEGDKRVRKKKKRKDGGRKNKSKKYCSRKVQYGKKIEGIETLPKLKSYGRKKKKKKKKSPKGVIMITNN